MVLPLYDLPHLNHDVPQLVETTQGHPGQALHFQGDALPENVVAVLVRMPTEVLCFIGQFDVIKMAMESVPDEAKDGLPRLDALRPVAQVGIKGIV